MRNEVSEIRSNKMIEDVLGVLQEHATLVFFLIVHKVAAISVYEQ